MANGIDIRTELLTRGRLMFLSAKETRGAEVRAINKAMTSVTAKASRLVRSEVTASAGAVKAAIKPKRATRAKPQAELAFSAKGIPLEEFKPTERMLSVTRATVSGRTKPYQVRGWSVKVKKKGKRQVVRQGFRVPAGKFLRTIDGPKRLPGKGVYSGRVARLRLQQAFGPSVATQVEPHMDELMAFTKARLDALMATEIRFADLRRRRGAPTRQRP
jgi:hypothetical protein